MERTPLKNLGLTFLHWLLFLAAAGLGAEVQLGFSNDTGTSDGGSFLPISIYEIHPVLYPFGTVLMIAALVWAWVFLFRDDLKHSMQHSAGWQILWWALWLAGCFAVFMGYLIIMMYSIGLFSKLEPDIFEMWMIVYPVAVLLTAVIACVVYCLREKRGNP